jgi:MFS superfamily sulfate permease-like transporter
VAILGRIPGTRRFSDSVRHTDNEPVPGILIVRPESGLVYFNIDHVRDRITAAAEATKPKLVLLDLSAAPRVDLQAAATLGALHSELAATGVRLQIVEAYASVRDKLRQEGLEEKAGTISRHTSVADAVDAFLRDEPLPG